MLVYIAFLLVCASCAFSSAARKCKGSQRMLTRTVYGTVQVPIVRTFRGKGTCSKRGDRGSRKE